MRQPVEGARGLRKEPAGMLVFTLRAAFEERDAMLDAELHALVVAGLEMQPRHVFDAAPVASVERAVAEDDRAPRRWAALAPGDDEQQLVGHALGDHSEEGAIEIRRRMVLAIGAPIARGEEVPILARRFTPCEAREAHARIGHAPAFLADLLALVVGEGAEELLEVPVAGIAPMELHAGALEHSAGPQCRRIAFCGKEHMQRRDLRFARELEEDRRELLRTGSLAASNRAPAAGVKGTAQSSFG